MSSVPPPPPPPPIGHDPAGPSAPATVHPVAEPWKRIAARTLDSVVLVLLIGGMVNTLIIGTNVTVESADVEDGRIFVASLVLLAIGFVWDPVMTKLTGGTPMKLAFGMRVVTTDREPVGWATVLKRWGVVAVWSLIPVLNLIVPLLLVLVSLVFLFTKPWRRAVWDLVADTIVVDTKAGSAV